MVAATAGVVAELLRVVGKKVIGYFQGFNKTSDET
jgi:hypothetical protein